MHSWQEQKSALEIFTRINARSQARLFILKTFPWLFPCIKNTQGINFISNFSIVTQKRKVGTIAPKKFIARLRKEKIEFDNYMQQVRLSTLLSIKSLVEGLFSSGCSWISNFPHQPHQRNYRGRAERRSGARCEPHQGQDPRHRHNRELDNVDQWNIPGDHWFVTPVTCNIINTLGNPHKRNKMSKLWDSHQQGRGVLWPQYRRWPGIIALLVWC